MPKNNVMLNARKNKKDEFYTEYQDIEKEIQYYNLSNKSIYCNCDYYLKSNFVKYFILNFNKLNIKSLTVTNYSTDNNSYHLYISQVPKDLKENSSLTNLIEILLQNKNNFLKRLNGNGDYKSAECIDILKQNDIVITNPPFSLFREFILTLIDYNKQFLILGNGNSILCKDIFPLIKENKIWYGTSIHSGDREFQVNNDYDLNALNYRVDKEDKKYIRVKGIRWFTNIKQEKEKKKLVLTKTYNAEDYPTYDNYNAIHISRTKDIPKDYDHIMGVPLTFFDNYNPQQFELVGITCRNQSTEYVTKIYSKEDYKNANDLNGSACLMENGKPKMIFTRLLIRKR